MDFPIDVKRRSQGRLRSATARPSSRACSSNAAEKRRRSCERAPSAWNMRRARVVGNLRTRTGWDGVRRGSGLRPREAANPIHLGRCGAPPRSSGPRRNKHTAPGNRQRPACKCSLRSNDRGPSIPCLTHFKTAFPASTEGCGTKTLLIESVLSRSARRCRNNWVGSVRSH